MYGWGGWPEYVPVAERKARAAKKIAGLKKQNKDINPVVIEGKNIASTFWGKAWCKNMESYSDYENRLPRGRSCVRQGSVIDLKIGQGKIEALVDGSSVYKINITIKPVPDKKWKDIVKSCSGQIDSLIELLQGKFSKGVMEIITHKEQGLFPHPSEINLKCSCPDWADMCKHLAATMYAIGARLDSQPQDLFTLRHVDHGELITVAETADKLTAQKPSDKILKNTDLSALFGIDIQELPSQAESLKKIKKADKLKKSSKVNIKNPTQAKVSSVKKSKTIKKIIEKKSKNPDILMASKLKNWSKTKTK